MISGYFFFLIHELFLNFSSLFILLVYLQMLPSGNLRSSLGKDSDRLVQLCHGSPGFILCLVEAAKTWPARAEEYLRLATRCGWNVFERGILLKGPGLCHGASGNALALLCLHEALEGDSPFEDCAKQMALAALTPEFVERRARGDRPLSLFEGR